MMILENNNGNRYEVLALSGYNKADREYYTGNSIISYHISAYGLLKLITESLTDTYVVASTVGRADWGNGAYFDNIKEAREYYYEKVKAYYGE